MGTVILRSQQATKNLHLLENTECRSFAPKSGAQDDGVRGVFPQPLKPGVPPLRASTRGPSTFALAVGSRAGNHPGATAPPLLSQEGSFIGAGVVPNRKWQSLPR